MQGPLAVTFGEPAGIGPDITLAAWTLRHELALSPFYVVADPDYLRRRAEQLRLTLPIACVAPQEVARVFGRALPVHDLGLRMSTPPGQPDDTSARAAVASMEEAARHVLSGQASAIVTNPIAKSALYRIGFTFPGHTEYLAALAQKAGLAARPVMMLWSQGLAVVPVTIHVPLARVPSTLTCDLIVETGRVVVRDLRARFRIPRPRLAVSGLNPHAGEHGTLGDEEQSLIVPAIAQLRAEGVDVRGPVAADSMFHPAARATYDAALTMYHDQALIPIKTIAFDDAVNVTLGLPFVRTSPDHGTAFDIAGTGRANPSSFVAALRLAGRLTAAGR